MYNRARYLIFFQYIGTKYSGAAKVPPLQTWVKGVQDHIEDALQRLRPLNPVSLYISSRTDSGVHALSNSAHFDFQRKNDKPPFTEDILVEALNFHLRTEQISVTRAHRVPDDFNARFRALSRTYVYRIALGSQVPLVERDMCWNLRHTELDVGAMSEAAAVFVGTHDFSSFRAMNSDAAFKNPVKTLDVVRIEPRRGFICEHFHRDVPLWELTFQSKSFLYKQVRRMTGALVAVGQGRLTLTKLKEIMEARDSLAYPSTMTAPPQGLFLTRVNYSESAAPPPPTETV
ncbi:tRNA pseudouridine synthase-like 1 isoform X2 [Dunckerocampus dactyliophorus]|uniref:tRNA pseudouridine synthase-like 1 isoform X2 n=1 Tax=Dunckerocampus dactyliophorus TaxID=161453 RepID=UPI0024071551|nr:tRNA pseudouridine synthase-like 1 isoform X2 [Dunckerocampus dactyliophorus]